MSHIPGKENVVADYLSRHVIPKAQRILQETPNSTSDFEGVHIAAIDCSFNHFHFMRSSIRPSSTSLRASTKTMTTSRFGHSAATCTTTPSWFATTAASCPWPRRPCTPTCSARLTPTCTRATRGRRRAYCVSSTTRGGFLWQRTWPPLFVTAPVARPYGPPNTPRPPAPCGRPLTHFKRTIYLSCVRMWARTRKKGKSRPTFYYEASNDVTYRAWTWEKYESELWGYASVA